MKKIVIAIDYNPTSEQVVKKGYELAKNLNAQICLLHVISDGRYYGMQYPSFLGYDGFSMPVNYEIQENLAEVASDFVTKAARHLKDENVDTKIVEGDAAEAILKYCNTSKSDILVMGTHSHSLLEKIFMGTTAQTVLEKTKIPVYLVPIKRE